MPEVDSYANSAMVDPKMAPDSCSPESKAIFSPKSSLESRPSTSRFEGPDLEPMIGIESIFQIRYAQLEVIK
jgi:hypothetical protein